MWLVSRGGRTEADVLGDERGQYVMMNNRTIKTYIPPQEELERLFSNTNKHTHHLGLAFEQEVSPTT